MSTRAADAVDALHRPPGAGRPYDRRIPCESWHPDRSVEHREALGLYIHIPFCLSICNYCNFNRGLFDAGLKGQYVAALDREIGAAGRGEVADTIYFGGGTPSLLDCDEIGRLVAACRSTFAVSSGAEVTLEANPETVTEEQLAGYRAAGVTRLSFGVQSFRDEELKRLDRRHDAEQARRALRIARAAGFDNISLDLMMWLPQQSLADWMQSIDELIRLAPDHASLYLLELYPNAPIQEAMARGQWSRTPDDDAADMYVSAMERLEAAGYRQYEISNVARPGKESRHNRKYWEDGSWLGLGCGAHSTRNGVRWKNVSSPVDYVTRVGASQDLVTERRILSDREQLEEAMFMGLRLVEGVDLDRIRARYGVDVWYVYGESLARYVAAGLVERCGSCLRLTRRGMLLAQEVMTVFV